MPMFLLMVVCGVALFVAIVFYLFYSPGKTKLINPTASSRLSLPLPARTAAISRT